MIESGWNRRSRALIAAGHMRYSLPLHVVVLLAAVSSCASALAQQIPNRLPSSAEPGRELQQPKPLQPVPEGTAIAVPESPAISPPANASQLAFTLKSVVVEGATLLSSQELERYYRQLLNRAGGFGGYETSQAGVARCPLCRASVELALVASIHSGGRNRTRSSSTIASRPGNGFRKASCRRKRSSTRTISCATASSARRNTTIP